MESYCTSLSSKTISYKIKKNELLEPIKFDLKVKKGDVIAKLETKSILAPFSGILGKRGISGSSLGSENTIILTLDDSRKVLCDLKIPEVTQSVPGFKNWDVITSGTKPPDPTRLLNSEKMRTFIKGIKVLKKKGRIVSFGFSSGKIEPIDINQLFVCLASKWRSLDLLGLGSKRKVGGSPKKYHLYRT